MATSRNPIENPNESGWTLTELMVVVTMLVVVLTAILSIADGTQKTAAADQERTNTIGGAQTGIARISDDLRNACLMFGANGSASAGYYCRVNFTQAPGTSTCVRSNDCVDLIVENRTAVTRPAGTPNRSLTRIRIDCAVADPASTAQTECASYAAACTAASCPSPTALSGVLVRSVVNSGTSPTPNVFVYCTREGVTLTAGTAACSATPATAGAVQISLAVSRRGTRKTGHAGSFLLQEGVELNNINEDVS